MMKTLRRGRRDKAKGISLYTATILDDVERENAQTPPSPTDSTSPRQPQQSPLATTSTSPRQVPPVPPKTTSPRSQLANSDSIPTRPPRTNIQDTNFGQSKDDFGTRTSSRPQIPTEFTGQGPKTPTTNNEKTGIDSSLSVVEDEPEDRDAYFLQKEANILKLRDNLKKVVSTGKKYHAESTKHIRGMNAVTDCVEKLGTNDRKETPDSVYVEALAKFVQIDKAVAESSAKCLQNLNDQLLHNINNFIEEDIQHELKNLKAKYEKARRDYDSACAKVTNLRSRKNLEIMKLYAAEKEAIKAKAKYKAALDAALQKVEDIELKKQTDLLEWIMTYSTAQKESAGECYAMLHHIENYLVELTNWAKEWRTMFVENTSERNAEQLQKFAEDDQAMHVPLTEVVKNEQLVEIMQQVSKEEAVPMPPLHSWQTVHAFLRDNYDPISQKLLAANRKQLLIELSSALGLLEKANETIELV